MSSRREAVLEILDHETLAHEIPVQGTQGRAIRGQAADLPEVKARAGPAPENRHVRRRNAAKAPGPLSETSSATYHDEMSRPGLHPGTLLHGTRLQGTHSATRAATFLGGMNPRERFRGIRHREIRSVTQAATYRNGTPAETFHGVMTQLPETEFLSTTLEDDATMRYAPIRIELAEIPDLRTGLQQIPTAATLLIVLVVTAH